MEATMQLRVVLSACALLAVVRPNAAGYTPCKPTTEVAGDPIPFRAFLNHGSFIHLIAHVSLLDKNQIVHVDQYFGPLNSDGVTSIVYNKQHQSSFIDGRTRQVLTLAEHGVCTGLDYHEMPGLDIWGWKYLNGSKYHYGPMTLYLLARRKWKMVQVSNATYPVNGVAANKWTTCTNDSVKVDMYFAPPNVSVPYQVYLGDQSSESLPLRIVVEGHSTDWENPSKVVDFKQVYDITFFDYINDELKAKFPQIPDGIECSSRKSEQSDLPPPPHPVYTFSMELVENGLQSFHNSETGHQTISFFQIWWDARKNLLRVDTKAPGLVGSGLYQQKIVTDFSTGLRYSIQQETNACQISGVTGDASQISKVNLFVGETMSTLFHLDSSYVCAGYKYGGPWWTSTKTNTIPMPSGGKYAKVVSDYFFVGRTSAPIWTVPTKAMLTYYDNVETYKQVRWETYNFGDYLASNVFNDREVFGVQDCYDYSSKDLFMRILFHGSYKDCVSSDEDHFKTMLQLKLVKIAGTSFLRFSDIQITYEPSKVVAEVIILEQAPAIYSFFKSSKSQQPWSSDMLQPNTNSSDDESCARYCNQLGFRCKGFFIAEDMKLCYVRCDPPSGSSRPGKFDYYYRLNNNATIIEQSNKEVFQSIASSVLDGEFTVSCLAAGGSQHMTASYIIPYADPLSPYNQDKNLRKFPVHRAKVKLPATAVDSKVIANSFDHCIDACAKNDDFQCETVSFCVAEEQCLLSRSTISEINEENLVSKIGCNVAIRDPTTDFKLMPGRFALKEANQVIYDAIWPSKCARECENAVDFTCRSFEFCRVNHSCSLHDTHITDIKSSSQIKNDSHCLHFSRNYLIDFSTPTKKQLSSRSASQLVASIDASQCARLCVEGTDFMCIGFDICTATDGHSSCLLHSDDAPNQAVYVVSAVCDIYQRKNVKRSSASSTGYTSGSMAALGICMLFIAMAVTVGGIYFFNKRR